MTKINSFIFDIDGTLIDTFAMYMPAMVETLRKHGYQIDPKDEQATMARLFGITGTDALKLFGVKAADQESIRDEWFTLAYQRENRVKPFQKIPAVLNSLAAVPGNKLGVATSKLRSEYDAHFAEIYPFAKLFDTVITSSDTSKHKPNPEPILAAVEKLGARPEESVYVGDTINDLRAAKAAGVKFAGALYGSANPDKLKGADYPLSSPLDLLKI